MSIIYLERELHNKNLEFQKEKSIWEKEKNLFNNKIIELNEIIEQKEKNVTNLKKQMENLILKIHLLDKKEILDFINQNELFKDKIINLNLNKHSKPNFLKKKNSKIKSLKLQNINLNKKITVKEKLKNKFIDKNKINKKYNIKCEKIFEKSKEKKLSKNSYKSSFFEEINNNVTKEKILKSSLNTKDNIINLNKVYSLINEIMDKKGVTPKNKRKNNNLIGSYDFLRKNTKNLKHIN